jgi:hypothetical protein
MRLFAQHGFGPSDKLIRGAHDGLIDGVILSARYLDPDAASETIAGLVAARANLEILFDPEYYAMGYLGTPNAQLGKLAEDAWAYFVPHGLKELLPGTAHIDEVLGAAFSAQVSLGCSSLIAPNVYVSKSFDSIESAIALGFITRARAVRGHRPNCRCSPLWP